MLKKFPYRYRVLIFLFFLILITYLDRVCISLTGVKIKAAFHLNNEQFGWVLGVFTLAYGIFEVPAGMLGDKIGQRAVFIRIVLWWSLFTILTGATTGFATLLIVRFLFGAGEAGAFPNSSGTISRWLPAAETARATSWLITGSNAGAAIAPLIIVPLAASYGWRVPFYVNGFIGVLWVLVCIAWFKNDPAQMKSIPAREKDLIEKNRQFVSHKEPFPWKTALKNKSLWAMVTAFFCSQWSHFFFIAWMPVYLQEGKHFSEREMKLATSWLFMVGIICGLVGGLFIDWFTRKKGLKAGRSLIGFLSLAAMSILFIVISLTSNNLVAAILLIISYAFVPVHGIVAFSTCVDLGRSKAGTVVGIMNFFGNMGAFFLSIIFGKIVDLTHSYSAPFYTVSAVLLVGSVLWLAVDPTKPIDVATAPRASLHTI